MMRDTVLPSGARLALERTRPIVPVLIEVPTLTLRPGRRTGGVGVKRRRRLRKEVRVTGSALLFGVPMTWALLSAWESRQASGLTGRMGLGQPVQGVIAEAGDPPIPVISLGPTLIPQERDRPVARTAGYLLPDDGAEDTGHAGR